MGSALATKTSSDETLIDPFQLKDWKNRTPPDHLYPKFKVFMENFKEQHPPNPPEMNPQRAPEPEATTNNEVKTQAEEQGSRQDLINSESAKLNALLKGCWTH